jgi:hypothetical protein
LADQEKSSRDVYAHSRLVNEILLAIGSRPECRVWKNATGTAKSFSGNTIKFGKKGSSDIIGITSDGKFLAIECKTGAAVQTKEQRTFEKMITFFGGRYILARTIDDVLISLAKMGLPIRDNFSGEI